MGRCGRCGAPATTKYASDMLAYTHGMALPYCKRCVVEEQLNNARAQADSIYEWARELAALGGPAERLICGYTYRTEFKDPDTAVVHNLYCVLDKGHEGDHEEAEA